MNSACYSTQPVYLEIGIILVYVIVQFVHVNYVCPNFVFLWRGYAGSRDYVENLQSPWRTYTDPRIPLKNRTPTLAPCAGVLCIELARIRSESAVLFFSGMCGSVWGPPRRLQVPYVILRPGYSSSCVFPTTLSWWPERRLTISFYYWHKRINCILG